MIKQPSILDLLPSSARIIAEVIGTSATLALSEKCYERSKSSHHCNVNLYIPKKIPRGHWLTACVGLKLSTKLQKELGGELFPIPKCRSVQRSIRNQQILDSHHSGKTVEEIREAFKISTATLARIIRAGAGGAIGTSEEGPLSSGSSRRRSVDNEKLKSRFVSQSYHL